MDEALKNAHCGMDDILWLGDIYDWETAEDFEQRFCDQ